MGQDQTKGYALESFNDIVTNNAEFKSQLDLAQRLSTTDVNILILGESGTGKTMLARAIHNASNRKEKSFVDVNCSAIPDSLLESELFGHERGSFTSADRMHRGRFELANEGTLFLDEIGDLSLSAQAKILRAVESRVFERVGGEQTISSNARIIAATNKNVYELIAAKSFREDLFYRLNEVRITIPPLRDRKEDIPVLIDIFIERYNQIFGKKVRGLSDVAMHYLVKYDWPGNVREISNVIKRGIAVTTRDLLWLEDLSVHIAVSEEATAASGVQAGKDILPLQEIEKAHIKRALDFTEGNKKEAALLLKIARSTLIRKLKEYGLSEYLRNS